MLKTVLRRSLRRRSPVSALLAFALIAAMPAAANAHAVVVSSTPAANALVAPGVLSFRLQLSSRIDPARSRVTLVAPDGAETVVPFDASAPGVVSGRARVATAGPWKLHWQVLSLDGHLTRGDVPFRVRVDPQPK